MTGKGTVGVATDRSRVAVGEWPTIMVLAACYGLWLLVVFVLADVSLWFAIPALAPVLALHSSLTHEAIHGHPTRWEAVNAALVALPLTIWVPYLRFKDQHLAHHHDEIITDPYDDPESNFLDPAVWNRLSLPVKALLRFNNTLFGRLTIGPLVGLWNFIGADLRLIAQGDRRVLAGWLLHLPPLAIVLAVIWAAPMPVWAYLVSAHFGLGILKIRTFLEHRVHEKARGRTVVIEDRGPLAFVFLNNNFHAVHHMHPRTPWYQLPALYRDRADHYLARNDGYYYRSYGQVLRQYFWKAKDPVPHPLWPK